MSAKIEQLRQTVARVANVHQLLSAANFNIQGSETRRVIDALAFIEGLHNGMVEDLKKLESGEGEPAAKPTAPAPAAVPNNVAKMPQAKNKGSWKNKAKAKPAPAPAPKEEAAK